MSHQFNGGVLELLFKYGNSDTEWHPFDLVKSDYAHSVATYVLNHDLGKTANALYRRWARVLLQAMKMTVRRMKQSNVNCLHKYSFHPTNKKAMLKLFT